MPTLNPGIWLAAGVMLVCLRAEAVVRRLDDGSNSTDDSGDDGGDDNTTYAGMSGDQAQAVVAAVGIGAGLIVAIFGAVSVAVCCNGHPNAATKARCGGWSIAGAAAVVAIIGILIATACVSQIVDPVVATGYTAALALSLPLFFAFSKAGWSGLLGVSTEQAWCIHGLFGAVFLVFGTVHGGYAIWVNGSDVVNVAEWLIGLLGGVLLWVGVLPIVPRVLCPRLFSYDAFKILHYVAMAGYLLAWIHMILLGAVAVIVLNAVALGGFILQKLYVVICTGKLAEVVAVTNLEEGDLKHVVLDLKVPGFRFGPGQWAHLKVPGLSVAHPFTLIPGQAEDQVRIIAKVGGRFTAALFERGDRMKTVRLEGPYGSPPLPAALTWVRGVVFVVGGVGVTPLLALLPVAAASGRPVRLLWSLRSIGLLHTCAPLIEKHTALQHRRISVFGGPAEPMPSALPLGATTSRLDVAAWLGEMAEELRNTGGPVLLFVCGPPGLAKAACAGAGTAQAVPWHVHVELFNFLPAFGS